ncbi:hypothetical protein ACFV3E_28780 [Streptomyces sp. NPDC059718]
MLLLRDPVLPTEGVAEQVQPILEILPPQMPGYEVTITRGQDPDAAAHGPAEAPRLLSSPPAAPPGRTGPATLTPPVEPPPGSGAPP